MFVRRESPIIRPRLLFAAGLGVPTAGYWVDSEAEGEEKALEYLKKNTEHPAYVFKILRHYQANVKLYEIDYED